MLGCAPSASTTSATHALHCSLREEFTQDCLRNSPWPLHHRHRRRHLLSRPPRHAGPRHQSPRRCPKLPGCSTVAVYEPGYASRLSHFAREIPLFCRNFLSGRCWVRPSGLLLVSSTSPITFRTGMSGNSVVLQHFCLRCTCTMSAAYRTVPSRLQYGCSTSIRAPSDP
jgi:hypothetical protein